MVVVGCGSKFWRFCKYFHSLIPPQTWPSSHPVSAREVVMPESSQQMFFDLAAPKPSHPRQLDEFDHFRFVFWLVKSI